MQREVDFSRAPPPEKKKAEVTTSVLVLGDANADWLAYGLEDAFSERPEIAFSRKHRTDSGLIRYGVAHLGFSAVALETCLSSSKRL